MKTYKAIAQKINAMKTCNDEWKEKHIDYIETIMNNAPSGSGFDAGTRLDFEKSGSNKLVFETSFHHMNDNGYYVGWSEHKVVVTPNLCFEFDLRVTGRDTRNIKEHIVDTFHYWLNSDIIC